jgi:hypothetical protein
MIVPEVFQRSMPKPKKQKKRLKKRKVIPLKEIYNKK